MEIADVHECVTRVLGIENTSSGISGHEQR